MSDHVTVAFTRSETLEDAFHFIQKDYSKFDYTLFKLNKGSGLDLSTNFACKQDYKEFLAAAEEVGAHTKLMSGDEFCTSLANRDGVYDIYQNFKAQYQQLKPNELAPLFLILL